MLTTMIFALLRSEGVSKSLDDRVYNLMTIQRLYRGPRLGSEVTLNLGSRLEMEVHRPSPRSDTPHVATAQAAGCLLCRTL